MLISCDAVRHSMFVIVSTLGFLFTHLYDEMMKSLVEDYTLYSHKNRTFPKESVTKIIEQNNSTWNITTSPDIELLLKCQNGYSDTYGNNKAFDKIKPSLYYNLSTLDQDPRYECMKVALDSNYSFVVCVDEMENKPRYWDQGQIEHLYTWLGKDKQMGFMDFSGGNGFYALAATSMGHKSIVLESDEMKLNRISKGIKLSRLENKISLINAQITDGMDAHDINCTASSSKCDKMVSIDYITNMTNFRKVILRTNLKDNIVNALLETTILFSKLCIPFIITERETNIGSLDAKVSYIQLCNLLIQEQGYRPFTQNGIALALNNVLEWPVSVYWVAQANLIKH